MKQISKGTYQGLALAGLIIGSALVRFVGLDAGLPLFWNIDEVAVMDHVLKISLQDLNHHHFVYGSFGFYVLRLVTWGTDAIVWIIQHHAPVLADYYLTARILWALLGVITVVCVFFLGKSIADWKVGILSAALFSFSPLAIEQSHYALVETLMELMIVIALLGVVEWSRGITRGMYVASIAVGLAVVTKYNAIIFLLPIVWVATRIELAKPPRLASRTSRLIFYAMVLLGLGLAMTIILYQNELLKLAASWSNNGDLRPAYQIIFKEIIILIGLGALIGCVIAFGVKYNWSWANRTLQILSSSTLLKPFLIMCSLFIVVMPYAILDFPSFAQGFFYAFSRQVEGSAGFLTPGTLDYMIATQIVAETDKWIYVRYLINEWGWFVFGSMLLGTWAFWRSARSFFIPFIGVTLLTILIASQGRYQGIRYLYPIWVVVALLGGFGLVLLVDGFFQWFRSFHARFIFAACSVCLFITIPIQLSVAHIQRAYLVSDTNNIALNWVLSNVPPGTTMLREWGTPAVELVTAKFRVFESGYAFETATLDQWRLRGVTMVLSSTIRYNYYLAHASQFANVLAQYDELKRWDLVYSIEPTSEIKGPPVYIYSLP